MTNIRTKGGVLLMALTILSSATTYAQDSKLNKEIVVEKNFKPTETEANKLNISPDQVEITIEDKTLDYSNWAVPTTVTPTLQTLSPIEYQAAQLASNQRGYLQVGLGSYLDTYSALGYRVLDGEKSKLNVWGAHASTWLGRNNSPNIITPSGENPKQQFNDAVVGVSYTQLLKGAHTLNADAYYHMDRFNYYGSPLEMDMQAVNEFNLALGMDKRAAQGELNYSADLEYNYWGNSYDFSLPLMDGVVENNIKLAAAAETEFERVGMVELELDANYLFYNHALPAAGAAERVSDLLTIGITPAYKYETSNLALQLGVNLDLSVEDESKFYISPAVKLDYAFNQSVAAYAYLLGGSTVNSYADISAKNRYFNPSLFYGESYSPLDATLGVKFIPFEGFKGEVMAGYAIVNNQMLPYYYNSGVTTIYNGVNMKGWYVAAELEYSYKSLGSARIGAKYAPQTAIDRGYAFNDDRALLILNGEVTAKPIDGLQLSLGYEYRGGREVWGVDINNVITKADLGSVNNLYLKADYKINDKFSAFANIDNILFQQWDNYYGMGAQKLGAVAGISIIF